MSFYKFSYYRFTEAYFSEEPLCKNCLATNKRYSVGFVLNIKPTTLKKYNLDFDSVSNTVDATFREKDFSGDDVYTLSSAYSEHKNIGLEISCSIKASSSMIKRQKREWKIYDLTKDIWNKKLKDIVLLRTQTSKLKRKSNITLGMVTNTWYHKGSKESP